MILKIRYKMSYFLTEKLTNNEIISLSEILELPAIFLQENKYLSCIDKEDIDGTMFYLLHYNPEKAKNLLSITKDDVYSTSNIEIILQCRGWIINMNTKKIVCKSYGYPINVNIDEIPNQHFLINELGGIIDPNELKFNIYYGGTLIRIWNNNGINMFSTHKKINAMNSKWGNNKTFHQLFIENQSIFSSIDDIPIQENTVSIFLINDISLLTDTRTNITNKVVYIETIIIPDSVFVNETYNNQQLTNIMIEYITEKNFNQILPISFPQSVSLQEANSWLKYGNITQINDDKNKNWYCGEKILVKYNGYNYTFISTGSEWRSKIIDNKHNVYQIFCTLLSELDNEDNKDNLIQAGLPINILETMFFELKETGKISIEYENFADKNETKYLIAFSNLFFALPVGKLDELFIVYNQFDIDLINAADFLYKHKDEFINLYKQKKLQEFPSLHNKKTIVTELVNQLYKHKNIFNSTKQFNENYTKWPSQTSIRYKDLMNAYKLERNNKVRLQISIEAQLIEFLMNLPGGLLYSFISFPERYQKTMTAREKTSSRVV